MAIRVLCFGGGGHASVVIDLIQSLGTAAAAVGIIGGPAETGDVLGVPVLGNDLQLLQIITQARATHFVVGIGTVRGGGTLRPRLFDLALSVGLKPFTAIHPSAVIARSAMVGRGATVMAGAVIQARASIGENAIVNSNASVDHDCYVGAHAHLAPGVVCSGGVIVGKGAHIGTGAVVLQSVKVGENATVGAGATVIADCGSGVTIIGTPARPI